MCCVLQTAQSKSTDRLSSARSLLEAVRFLEGKSLQLSLLCRDAFTLNSDMNWGLAVSRARLHDHMHSWRLSECTIDTGHVNYKCSSMVSNTLCIDRENQA